MLFDCTPTINNTKVEFNTGRSIATENWSPQKEKAIPDIKANKEFNSYLESFGNKLFMAYSSLLSIGDEISAEKLKQALYQYLSPQQKQGILPLHFGDQQLSTICRDYYKDQSFCREENGSINLWKLYNLFTSANKSTYIDGFLEKAHNAEEFVVDIQPLVFRCEIF